MGVDNWNGCTLIVRVGVTPWCVTPWYCDCVVATGVLYCSKISSSNLDLHWVLACRLMGASTLILLWILSTLVRGPKQFASRWP